MEVTLNHIINQFLSLAPSSLRNLIFERALGGSIPGEFVLRGRDLGERRPHWDTCQPDFQFTSADRSSTIFIEMKLESHCRIEQVLKYVALALSNEQAQGQAMQNALIFLGKGSFKAIWRKSVGITAVEELHSALLREQEEFCESRLKNASDSKCRFTEILSSMRFGFLNYADLGAILLKEREVADAAATPLSYVRLLDGLLQELRQRKLVPVGE